jgi:hypothetical protein
MSSRPIQVMPDMRIVHPEYGDLTEDVARELNKLNQAEAERIYREAQPRQRRIAGACGQEAVINPGGLRLVAQIDETVFNYRETREGPEFWKHALPFMLKRHPELAVRARPARTSVLLDGFGRPAGLPA